MIREVRLLVHQACEEKDYIFGASCVYICVIGTMCEPLFAAQFPRDSWIRRFEIPKGAAEHKLDKPADTTSGVRYDDRIFICLLIYPPSDAGPSHLVADNGFGLRACVARTCCS